MISDAEIAVRLLLAAAIGGVVGLERELRDQPAGLRTHLLVAVGSCLFTLVSAFGFDDFTGRSATEATRADVTRIASQVVVGIGFLGGGAILRHGTTIRGLTTAASLWVTAAVGIAIGMGFYFGAGITGAIVVVTLAALKPFEKRLVRGIRQDDDPRTIDPD